jgi:ribosomal protein S12 methylthiotransferase
MMARLNSAGWVSSDDPEPADLIIVNSCGFIESAKRESINAVLAWRKEYPRKKILLSGCLARRYARELSGSLSEADLIFGGMDLSRIAEIAGEIVNGAKPACTAVPAARPPFSPGSRPLLSLPGSAYVKISEGCNNRCSFCAIPLIRGPLRSRSISEVINECALLLDRGIRELCLIGQDIGSYGADFPGGAPEKSVLPDLLKAVAELRGGFWVRLLYIHPDHFPLGILDIMRKDKRFLPYFDIPFQHGSAKILKAMNRKGSAETYLELIDTIRSSLDGAVIRSTFMTGFPGESEGDFAALLDFQQKARLDWLGCFTYSREDGTAAFSMKGRVSKKTSAERKTIIEEKQIPVTGKNMDRFIGQNLDVLVEEEVDREDGLYLGRLYCHAPEVDGAAVITITNNTGSNNTAGAPGGGGTRNLQPGTFARGMVCGRAGFDLEVKIG